MGDDALKFEEVELSLSDQCDIKPGMKKEWTDSLRLRWNTLFTYVT